MATFLSININIAGVRLMSPRPWPLTVTCHDTSQLSLSLSGCAQLYCAPLSRGGDGDGDDMMMMGRASWVLSVVTAPSVHRKPLLPDTSPLSIQNTCAVSQCCILLHSGLMLSIKACDVSCHSLHASSEL